jgi:hypothetical protein
MQVRVDDVLFGRQEASADFGFLSGGKPLRIRSDRPPADIPDGAMTSILACQFAPRRHFARRLADRLSAPRHGESSVDRCSMMI